MKRSVFNWVAGGVAFVLAIVLKLYFVSAETEPRFFLWFEAALCLLGLGLWIVEFIRRADTEQAEKERQEQENAVLFADAEQLPRYHAAEMFAEAFDAEEASPAFKNAESDAWALPELAYSSDADTAQSFANAAREFELFARQRGCQIRPNAVRRLFASLASSRLIVFGGMEPKRFRTIVRLLSEYFGSAPYMDEVSDAYTDAARVLFSADPQGGRLETNALCAIKVAEASPQAVVLAGLDGVRCNTLASYFAPYMSHIRAPLSGVSVRTADGEEERRIPRNVWFLLNLAEGEAPDALDLDILAHAAFVTAEFDSCPVSDQPTQVGGIGYYQMEYLKDKASDFAPDEALWKKIDRLETSVSYQIGNKQWLGLEHFACVYAACGGDAQTALDEAAASRLIVPMTAHLRLGGAPGELGAALQNVFGEERGEVCKKLEKLLNERLHD